MVPCQSLKGIGAIGRGVVGAGAGGTTRVVLLVERVTGVVVWPARPIRLETAVGGRLPVPRRVTSRRTIGSEVFLVIYF